MNTRNVNYRDYTRSLLAGVPQRIAVAGDYFQIIKSVSDVMLTFDDQVSITRRQGTGGPTQYNSVTLTSAVDQSVTVSLGYIDGLSPYDNNPNFAQATINASINVGANLGNGARVTIAAGASAEVFPASATRLGWVLVIPETAADGLRIGSPGISAATGIPILFGTRKVSENISPRGAVHIFNGSGAPVIFDRLEQLL